MRRSAAHQPQAIRDLLRRSRDASARDAIDDRATISLTRFLGDAMIASCDAIIKGERTRKPSHRGTEEPMLYAYSLFLLVIRGKPKGRC